MSARDARPPASPRAPRVAHPFLFALYPIVFLWSRSAGTVGWQQVVRPLVVVMAAVAVLYVLARIILRTPAKAALAVSWFVALFFSYGRFYEAVGEAFGGRHRWPACIFALLFVAGMALIVRTRRRLYGVTTFLNLFGACAVSVAMLTGLVSAVSARQAARVVPQGAEAALTASSRPDIYYIVLDAYSRQDVLKELYGVDDGGFTRFLQSRGFQVIPRANSNYCQTALSLASSLNYRYLDDVARRMGPDGQGWSPVFRMIRNSAVSADLKRLGYRTVAFSSGYSLTEVRQASIYLQPRVRLSEFATVLINTTPLPIILLRTGARYGLHRERINYTFDTIPDIAGQYCPKFVFAHICAPHPPFVFTADGRPLSPLRRFTITDGDDSTAEIDARDYRRGYAAQARWIARKTEKMVDNLLRQSPRPPVIIIQADHGPRMLRNQNDPRFARERMSILLAIHMPEDACPLPPDLSPVNVFRVVLNQSFGAKLPLLPNRSYFSTFARPYHFKDVTPQVSQPR